MTQLPEKRRPRITSKAFNLRSITAGPDWERVDARALLRRIKHQRSEGVDWKIVPWQRNLFGVHRSYIALCEDGAIYAVFMRRSGTA